MSWPLSICHHLKVIQNAILINKIILDFLLITLYYNEMLMGTNLKKPNERQQLYCPSFKGSEQMHK